MFVIKHWRDVSLTYPKILWSMCKLLIVRLRLYGEIIWSLIFVTLANHIHNFDIFRPGQHGKPLPRLHIIRKDSQSITLPPYHWLFQDTTETFAKRPLLPPATGGTLGSNFNPQNTQCIPACPVGPADRTGVVKIFACLELESRYSGKHFSKVSSYFLRRMDCGRFTEKD